MQKLKLLFIPFLLNAANFNEITKLITNSLSYQMAKKEVLIYRQKLKSAEAKNYGSLDLSYSYVRLNETPILKMNTQVAIGAENLGNAPVYPLIYKNINTSLQAGSRNNYTGILKYSYPIFTGFAISNLIKKSKIELIQKELELKNTKRILLLNAAKLYSQIYSVEAKINALKKAKEAVISANKKALAFYKEGLLAKSQVDEINAKYYEIKAQIDKAISQKKALLNMLSTLLNTKINKIDGIVIPRLKKENILKRPDILAIKKNLKITQALINIAKSKDYPQIGFEIALKKEANTPQLNKNDYQNIDKSYAAIEVNYNIFDGGAKEANIQVAKLAKLQSAIYYQNYLNNAKTEYKNDLLTLKALKAMFISAKEEIKARRSYYEYIKAKFNEGLADISDLTDAIAKLADARAKKDAIKANIFFYTIKANLDGGASF